MTTSTTNNLSKVQYIHCYDGFKWRIRMPFLGNFSFSSFFQHTPYIDELLNCWIQIVDTWTDKRSPFAYSEEEVNPNNGTRVLQGVATSIDDRYPPSTVFNLKRNSWFFVCGLNVSINWTRPFAFRCYGWRPFRLNSKHGKMVTFSITPFSTKEHEIKLTLFGLKDFICWD